MKTFPDFTWDYIIQNCEWMCSHVPRREFMRSAQGLIAIVPKLREHPNLSSLVPMMSLIGLRWFPADGLEIGLFCDGYTSEYSITVTKRDLTVVEKKIVDFDEVADQIYASITKFRQD